MNCLAGYLSISLSLFVYLAKCEVYTSVEEMKDVVVLEKGLVEALEKYIELEMEKLNSLMRYLSNYIRENENALKDSEVYVGNPINAYLLIKRLTVDWQQVESLISLNNRDKIDIAYFKEHPKFPTAKDLNGTIVALARLQDTYDFDTALIARGEFNGIKYSSELSASDCFEIGRQCYENHYFEYSYSWLVAAEDRIAIKPQHPGETVERSRVLEYMALSAHKLGNVVLALNITNKLLRLVPNHSEALERKIAYENYIQENDVSSVMTSGTRNKSHQLMLYQKICKGAIVPPVEFYSELKCRHLDNNSPFLFFSPYKVEELSTQPKITLFHDVISDEEINGLKTLSVSRFKTAMIATNMANGTNHVSPDRIAKAAWFLGSDDKLVATINRRISHMTGLNVETAEALQTSNYGIGGHFLTHYDFIENITGHDILKRGTGNRIATVMFYMSDVFQGGETVFSVPKIKVKPKKGTALVWHNLHPNGDGDINTVHGSCPVVIGSKWTATKWLHEYGQEFLRPCEVTRYPYGS